jgi:flagellar basal-body rod protein FlgG
MGRVSVCLGAFCALIVGVVAVRFLSVDPNADLDYGGPGESCDPLAVSGDDFPGGSIDAREENVSALPGRITLEDVAALSAAGVADQVVVDQVRSADDVPALSAADVLSLHRHGVSARVITAWQRRSHPAEIAGLAPMSSLLRTTALSMDASAALELAAPADCAATRTALAALAAKRDVIANNMANAQTIAFKRSRVMLADLAYRHAIIPGAQDAAMQLTSVGVSVGQGAGVQCVQTDFSQGPLAQTGGELDMAIEGKGFFQLQDTDGQLVYTRAGNFSVNDQGTVVVSSSRVGRVLLPQLTIPPDTTSITIGADGTVSITQSGNPLQQQIGQVQLAQFINPQGLMKVGENLYSETKASGPVQLQNPRVNGVGIVRQRTLELSNVDVDAELAELHGTLAALAANKSLLAAPAEAPAPLETPTPPERLDTERTATHDNQVDDRVTR